MVHSALDASTELCVSCPWQDKESADKMHTNFSALGRILTGDVANRGRKHHALNIVTESIFPLISKVNGAEIRNRLCGTYLHPTHACMT
jgi:hypothetical protein